MPANTHPIAPTRNERVTAGPAASADAAAVRTKRPAPMIAPIPSATRPRTVKERLSRLSLACCKSVASDFFLVKLELILSLCDRPSIGIERCSTPCPGNTGAPPASKLITIAQIPAARDACSLRTSPPRVNRGRPTTKRRHLLKGCGDL